MAAEQATVRLIATALVVVAAAVEGHHPADGGNLVHRPSTPEGAQTSAPASAWEHTAHPAVQLERPGRTTSGLAGGVEHAAATAWPESVYSSRHRSQVHQHEGVTRPRPARRAARHLHDPVGGEGLHGTALGVLRLGHAEQDQAWDPQVDQPAGLLAQALPRGDARPRQRPDGLRGGRSPGGQRRGGRGRRPRANGLEIPQEASAPRPPAGAARSCLLASAANRRRRRRSGKAMTTRLSRLHLSTRTAIPCAGGAAATGLPRPTTTALHRGSPLTMPSGRTEPACQRADETVDVGVGGFDGERPEPRRLAPRPW